MYGHSGTGLAAGADGRSGLALALVVLVACSNHAPHPAGTGTTSQKLTSERQLSLSLPNGTRLHDLAVTASSSLRLGPEASVVTASSGFAPIASSGDDVTELGPAASAGNVWSKASLVLRPRAQVNGFATTAATVDMGPNAVIAGPVVTGAVLTPVQPFSWKVDFETSNANITVKVREETALAPGAYGDVDVKPSGTLRLASGTYHVRALRLAPGARVVAETQADPTLFYADTELDLKGAVESEGDRFFIAYLGSGTARLHGPFSGTIVAPHGGLTLGPGEHYTGSFFGRTIDVGPRAVVTFKPFAAWEFIFPPRPVLECVSEFNTRAYNALFGYDNPLDIEVTIPVGARNRLEPTDAGTPPTVFLPGRVRGVFTTQLSEAGTSYHLGSETAQATRATLPRCTGAEYVNVPRTVPPEVLCVESPSPLDPVALERLRTGRP